MGQLPPFQGRTFGPRSGPRVECAHNPDEFQVVGLSELSPIFKNRKDAEGWLSIKLTKLPQSKRPQKRRCLSCSKEFQSEGFHNRMCGPCRSASGGVDTGAHRLIRPSKRG